MKEEFVTYEIAKKLEVKGMGNDGNYGYNDKGEICVPVYNLDDDQVKAMCPCPQIHEVLKWLREEKKLHIEIVAASFGYSYIISKTPPLGGADVKFSKFEGPNDGGAWDEWEGCILAGIEYVIDKLI